MTFGFILLLFSSIPILTLNIAIIQPAMAQNQSNTSISSSSLFNSVGPKNDTTENGILKLPSQKGFSSIILATNFSEPHNILYGPDGFLWITERVGKTITIVDPMNGSKINSISVRGFTNQEVKMDFWVWLLIQIIIILIISM